MTTQQSNVINATRFILVTLVIFIHMLPYEHQALEWRLGIRPLYIFLSETISHNIGRMAVPIFFVFSGFLFIYSKGNSADYEFFVCKWKKRIKTLVIPYVLWNLIFILCTLLKNLTLGRAFGWYDEGLENRSLYDLFWASPADFPLWYLRDLICMTILTPLFYYSFKATRGILLYLIGGLYFIGLECNVPGLSSTAIFYYSCGVWMGMNQSNFLSTCLKYKKYIYLITSLLLFLSLMTNVRPEHEYAVRIFCPFAMASTIAIIGSLKATRIEQLKSLSGTCFFIYAIHELYILGWMNGIYLRMLGTSDIAWLIRYATEPFMVIWTCIMVYTITNKFCPNTLKIITGNRS